MEEGNVFTGACHSEGGLPSEGGLSSEGVCLLRGSAFWGGGVGGSASRETPGIQPTGGRYVS